jgi:hypothetical protein
LDQTAYGLWVEENPIPPKAGFDELLLWVRPLVEAEYNMGKQWQKKKSTDGAKYSPG